MTATAKVKAIPAMYRRVNPCLVVRGGVQALDFYRDVFQATERMRFLGPGEAVAHAEIEIDDSVIIVEDESPERGTKAPPPGGVEGSSFFLFIYVEDVDATVARAVELGATLVRAPENQFYGDRDGCIVDPFGHIWTIATHAEDVGPEEMARRVAALQEMASS